MEKSAERQILQHVVMKPTISGTAPLYLRQTGPENDRRVSTDTYINIFHLSQWKQATELKDFILRIRARGEGELVLHGVFAENGCMEIRTLESKKVKSENEAVTIIFRLGKCAADLIFFSWRAGQGKKLKIERAVYLAEAGERKDNIRAALVTTTYNRRDDIENLAETYRKACSGNKYLAEHTRLFIVNNKADDDLSHLADGEQIRLFVNNENTGGSGGFTRGAREALTDGGFSHVIFMDDDARQTKESWFRTLALLRNLRPELKEAFVAGGAFLRENPTFCHALREGLDERGRAVCLVGKIIVDKPSSFIPALAACELKAKAAANPYAAWWCCAIPLEAFKKYGFPLPMFCISDDIEFGLRTRVPIIYLNGICVWHPDFSGKSNLIRRYLMRRNQAITQAAHFSAWRTNLALNLYRRLRFFYRNGNFEECLLRITAVKDFFNFKLLPREGEKLFPHIETSCATKLPHGLLKAWIIAQGLYCMALLALKKAPENVPSQGAQNL